ncbi:MAG: ATP-binding protein [Planctomycetes bacterium]|nr:ATP-binding protein [Planctomycetota bacterium]
MLARHLEGRILAGLADSPVVFLQGPRQCGKSTLVQAIASGRHRARYISLDDPAQLAAARSDPTGFLAGFDRNVVIDEVQSAPELFPVLKRAVDRDRTPGRFLLTGSANALVVPEMARALTGRVDLVTLQGLSQGEIAGRRDGFVDWAFSDERIPIDLETPRDLPTRVIAGGFPEVIARRTSERRAAWFDSYITTLVQRDVRDLAQIDMLASLPTLLRMCAARVGGLLNFSELARTVSLSQTTLKRYFTLLEAVFLLHRLPAWHANLGKRLVRSPKVFLHDSGLACHLQGVDASSWNDPATRRGPLLETFALGELERQSGWSRLRTTLHHYRSHAGEEVDFVLEDSQGRIVCVEIKAAATPKSEDVAAMRKLAAELGPRCVRCVLLTTGSGAISYDARVHALPISALWSIEAPKHGRKSAGTRVE